MINKNSAFHDYLGLKDFCYSGHKFVIFYGKSGSGKSSYIEYLLNNNVSLQSKNHTKIEPHIQNKNIETTSEYILIDEFLGIQQYYKCFKYFFSAKQLIIASHLPKKFFFFLKLLGKTTFYSLDNHPEKITAYLDRLGYTYSNNTIETYIKNYSSTYTDIDIILEKSSGKNFCKIFDDFHKSTDIQVEQ